MPFHNEFKHATHQIWRYIPLLILLLISLSHPLEAQALNVPNLSDIPDKNYIMVYQHAAVKYGVPWTILASVHGQETTYSKNGATSSAGAIGHVQFMRKTWVGWSSPGTADSFITNPSNIKKYGGYGVDGNQDGVATPFDLVDAVYAGANLLAANYRSKKSIDGALRLYNGSATMYNSSSVITYSNEVQQRAKNIKEQYKGKVLEGADRMDAKTRDGNWYKGVSSGKDGKLKGKFDETDTGDTSGGATSDDEDSKDGATKGSTSSGDGSVDMSIYESPFKKYDNEVSNVGVNEKDSFDYNYLSYKINNIIKWVGGLCLTTAQAVSILLFGYLTLLWLIFLLARNNIIYMEEILYKMSNGTVDAYDGLWYLTKTTLFAFAFMILAVTGLLAGIFSSIYSLILVLLNYLTYML